MPRRHQCPLGSHCNKPLIPLTQPINPEHVRSFSALARYIAKHHGPGVVPKHLVASINRYQHTPDDFYHRILRDYTHAASHAAAYAEVTRAEADAHQLMVALDISGLKPTDATALILSAAHGEYPPWEIIAWIVKTTSPGADALTNAIRLIHDDPHKNPDVITWLYAHLAKSYR